MISNPADASNGSGNKIVIKTRNGMPTPSVVSSTGGGAANANDSVTSTPCTVMNSGSLLRDALMLPKSPLPRAIISLNNNIKGTFLHHNYASLPMIRDEQEPTSVNKVRHIISINKKSTIN